ncbi:hypothetical protein BsWGS_16070 [Bradybaena similaris]
MYTHIKDSFHTHIKDSFHTHIKDSSHTYTQRSLPVLQSLCTAAGFSQSVSFRPGYLFAVCTTWRGDDLDIIQVTTFPRRPSNNRANQPRQVNLWCQAAASRLAPCLFLVFAELEHTPNFYYMVN